MDGNNQINVLIVEDDIGLSSVIDRIIKSIDPSIQVDWCTSAEEAIGQLSIALKKKQKNPYRLVLSDVFLDGEQNGLDVLEFCKENGLNLQLIFMSATQKEKIFSGDKGHSPLFFLQKPFSVDYCRLLIKNLLFPMLQGKTG